VALSVKGFNSWWHWYVSDLQTADQESVEALSRSAYQEESLLRKNDASTKNINLPYDNHYLPQGVRSMRPQLRANHS
jgi:hypothetical protein